MGGKRKITKADLRQRVKKKLKGFDKESHAKSLAEGIMRSCKDYKKLPGLVEKANKVVDALRKKGVTSFFAAEYAKVFSGPRKALSTRKQLMAEFKENHKLTETRAAKMADCIVFSAAKKPALDSIDRLSRICSAALTAGVDFGIVADTAYYNQPDVSPERFSQNCVINSSKKNKPLRISEVTLTRRLSAAVSS